jgi:hypothetical protein
MNGQEWQSESFKRTEKEIRDYFLEKKAGFDEEAGRIASRKR